MRVFYSPQARLDLNDIHEYISTNLQNPTAAKNIISKITNSAKLLSENAHLGFSIAEKTGRETDIRCLLSGNYGVFYQIISAEILIVRILDVRTDYMKYIFSDE